MVGFVSVGIEELLSLDPEVLIDHPYRADGRARALFAPRSIADDGRLATLRAIREGRVVWDLRSAHLLTTTHHAASLVETLALALRIAEKSPLALKLLKRTLRQGLEMPLPAALAHEQAMIGLVLDSDDAHEGCRAFLEKRKPDFTGN